MSNGKIVVLGGHGFIGSHICQLAVQTRHDVVSISRSGKAPTRASWAQAVDWVKGDVNALEPWRAYLTGATAVIHCVGSLIENPLTGATFHHLFADSARETARAARAANVEAFVYLSAADAPFLPRRFMQAKRAAEAAVQTESHRWAALRPGLVYGWGRAWSVIPGKALHYAAGLPLLEAGLNALRPLPVETVAAAAMRAAIEPNQSGILDIDAIEHLGKSRLRDWQPQAQAKVA